MSNSYGPRLPDNIIQDNDMFGGGLQTTLLQGVQSAIRDSFAGSMFAVRDFTHKEYLQAFNPGEILTNEEWKKSNYYRPGLDIKGNIGENVARLEAQKYDEKRIFNARMTGLKPGITKTLSIGASQLFGFALNPVNLAGFTGADMIVGKGSALLRGMLEESNLAGRSLQAANIGLNITHGAATGALGFIPDVGARYISEDALDQNPSGLAALANLGLGAALGGVLHGAFGARLPVSEDAANQIRATAVEQVANGKSVHIDEIAQDGYRRQRAYEAEQTPEQATAAVQEKIDLINQTEKLQKNLAKATEDVQKTRANIKDSPTVIEAWERARNEIFANEENIRRKRAVEKWQRGEVLTDVDAMHLTKEDIERQMRGDDPILDQAAIRKEVRERKEVKRRATREVPEDTAKYEEMKEKFKKEKTEKTNAEIKAASEKGKYMSDLEKHEAALAKEKQARKELEDNLDRIQNHDANEAINLHAGEPVDINTLKQSAKTVNSFEGDHTVNMTEISNFTREMESLPKTHEEALMHEQEKIKQLDASGHFDEATKAELEDIKNIPKDQATFEDLVRKAANCLKGAL